MRCEAINGLKHDQIVNWGKYSRAGLESVSEFRVYGKLKYLNSNKMQNNSYLQKFDQNLTRTRSRIMIKNHTSNVNGDIR